MYIYVLCICKAYIWGIYAYLSWYVQTYIQTGEIPLRFNKKEGIGLTLVRYVPLVRSIPNLVSPGLLNP